LAVSTGAINSAITPILVAYYKNNERKRLGELASSLFNVIFLIFCVFGIIQYLFAEQILKLILPGFGQAELIKLVSLFRIQAFLSIITILTAILLALHYTLKNFYRTIVFSMIGQFAQIIFVWFFYKQYGVFSLVYGLVISQSIVFVLLMLPFINLYSFRIVYNAELKNASHKIFPLIVSSAFSKSNMLVDRFFASTLSAGSITLLQYGEKIISIISGFINKGISLVSLRKFSLEQDNEAEFQRLFYLIYKTMIFLVVPVTFIIIFFLKDALNIILLSNNLALQDVEKIYWVTIAFIGIFIGGSLNSTITNAFYAKGLTSLVARVAVVFQFFGIGFKVLLYFMIGFWGLPIAFSLNSILGVIALFVLYYKHIYKYNILLILKYTLKMTLISIVAIILSKLAGVILPELWYVRLLIELGIFLAFFGVFSKIIENDISSLFFSKIKIFRK